MQFQFREACAALLTRDDGEGEETEVLKDHLNEIAAEDVRAEQGLRHHQMASLGVDLFSKGSTKKKLLDTC